MMGVPEQFRNEVADGALEIRSFDTGLAEVRVDDDGVLKVAGIGSVYGQRTTIGSFWQWDEEVMPGAWTKTIGEADVRSMFNHDPNRLLGRTSAGTLSLEDRAEGLFYETTINQDDPNAVAVHSMVERGDVSGASVWFRVIKETWTEPTEENGLERELRQIVEAELFEVGPVVFPAFPQTTATARSLDVMLRQAGVEKSARRAAITADLLADPSSAETRINELFARRPELREKVCSVGDQAAAVAPTDDVGGPLRSHSDVDVQAARKRFRALELQTREGDSR